MTPRVSVHQSVYSPGGIGSTYDVSDVLSDGSVYPVVTDHSPRVALAVAQGYAKARGYDSFTFRLAFRPGQ